MFIALNQINDPRSIGAQCIRQAHVAPNGANYGGAPSYKHSAPPEQRQVSQIRYFRFAASVISFTSDVGDDRP